MKKILFSLFMLCGMTVAVAQPSPGGGYTADSYEKLKACVENAINNGIPTATITLTADIYLKDEGELCNTFKGTLDGNGYTIYAGDENTHQSGSRGHGKYLFVYSVGAKFRNLTFKDFRADTDEHSYWSVLTSQATNCTFENITFENVSVWSNYSNVGAVAGYANNCTFTNITVNNSDFAVDDNNVGAVVGDAIGCTFTNIEVNTCKATTDDQNGGGVVGNSNACTFTDIQIKNSWIMVYDYNAGGVAGKSLNSSYIRCIIDDQSCVSSDGQDFVILVGKDANAGGVVGYSEKDEIHHCINSALVAAAEFYAGGIVGATNNNGSVIEDCLNTGLIIAVSMSDVRDHLYSDYKNKNLEYEIVTRSYKGKTYDIRRTKRYKSNYNMGGIVGISRYSTISRCTDYGLIDSPSRSGGIVGAGWGGSISDCLVDFPLNNEAVEYYDETYCAVLGIAFDNITVQYCIYLQPMLSSTSFSYVFRPNLQYSEAYIWALNALGSCWEINYGNPCPTPTVTVFYDNLENEARYNYHYYSTTGSVVIKRTFDNDGWYSLCLPFDVDATQTAEKFAQVAEFSELDGNTNTYKFTTVDHIEAGKPYIVRVDTKLENPKFSSVTIAANVEADNSGAFVGVLKPTEVKSGDLAIGSGTTVNPMHEGTMKAFRAYFPQTSANATKAMRFTVDDGEATSIELMQNAEPKEGGQRESQCRMQNYYNLSGQKVDENYRGIVIKNGKKILKK